jgi:hypothetical protein
VDQELQTYYDNYFNLFMTEGWRQLIEDFGSNLSQINSVEATKDSEDLQFRKGQLNVLAHLINMETIISNNYDEASKVEDD